MLSGLFFITYLNVLLKLFRGNNLACYVLEKIISLYNKWKQTEATLNYVDKIVWGKRSYVLGFEPTRIFILWFQPVKYRKKHCPKFFVLWIAATLDYLEYIIILLRLNVLKYKRKRLKYVISMIPLVQTCYNPEDDIQLF